MTDPTLARPLTADRSAAEALNARMNWVERDVLRGTEDPANWGVPEDYAAGFIAGVHAFREALDRDRPSDRQEGEEGV